MLLLIIVAQQQQEEEEFEEEDVGHEVASDGGGTPGDDTESGNSGGNPDESFVDRCVVHRGPQIVSSTSQMYPVTCPALLNRNLPIHPSNHHFTREQCTIQRLHQTQDRLTTERERLSNVTSDLVIFNRYLHIQETARDNVFSRVAAARASNPNFNDRIPMETERRTRIMCENDIQRIRCFLQHLGRSQIEVRGSIRQLECEESAIRFAMNYASQHPTNEFVIYMFEETHVIQQVNHAVLSRFHVTPSPSIEPEEEVPERPGEPPRKRPRDKRSNTETNSVFNNEQSVAFKVIEIDHAFELQSILDKRENVLIVFPDKIQVVKDLTETLENNFILLADSVRTYYTSGWYDSKIHEMTKDFFHFTNRLLSSSVPFKAKKALVKKLNAVIFTQLDHKLGWFYDTTASLKTTEMAVKDVSSKLYAIKI
jgi:hypothetical protein